MILPVAAWHNAGASLHLLGRLASRCVRSVGATRWHLVLRRLPIPAMHAVVRATVLNFGGNFLD
jgi:hypothetical protein